MSSRSTKLLVALLILLFLAGAVYLWVTTTDEMDDAVQNVERTEDEPIELRDDEVDLPAYRRGDSLNESGIRD